MSYIDQFMQVAVEVEGAVTGLKCWIFENDLLQDCPFRQKLGRMEAYTIQNLFNKAQSFFNLEEKLNTRFDKLDDVNANSSRLAGRSLASEKMSFIG